MVWWTIQLKVGPVCFPLIKPGTVFGDGFVCQQGLLAGGSDPSSWRSNEWYSRVKT